MLLKDALFKAMDKCGLTAKELSERSGVTQAQISRFRKGEDLAFLTFQRLVAGLPREAYHQFTTTLVVEQMDSQELGNLIMSAVTQLQQKPVESKSVIESKPTESSDKSLELEHSTQPIPSAA